MPDTGQSLAESSVEEVEQLRLSGFTTDRHVFLPCRMLHRPRSARTHRSYSRFNSLLGFGHGGAPSTRTCPPTDADLGSTAETAAVRILPRST